MPTILVIDDSEATAFSVRSAVPECEVLYARDGIEGLDIFRQHADEIDLVVLDIQMPYLDGRATCIKIRSTKKDVPIVPFTGYPDEDTLSMLRELGCTPPLIKPADPDLIARTIREALAAPPPTVMPSAALLAYTQELVTTQEQMGRAERAARVMIYASSLSVREGLKALLEKAGASASLKTIHASHVQAMLKAETGVVAIVTTLADLPEIQTFIRERDVPVLCLASTLRDGLALVDLARQAELKMGIVVESPLDEAETLSRLRAALQALAHGQESIPNELRQPFAALRLSPQEQSVLALEVQGLSQNDIADRLGIEAASVRQYRTRLAQKLEVENQTLRDWAEAWWSAQHNA